MGDSFPSAEVIGIDLSPIQPSWVPPNVQFVVDDVECDWMFSENSFEFIHIRSMLGSIKDWPHLLAQCYKSVPVSIGPRLFTDPSPVGISSPAASSKLSKQVMANSNRTTTPIPHSRPYGGTANSLTKLQLRPAGLYTFTPRSASS